MIIQVNNKFAEPENSKSFLIPEDKWFYFAHGRRASSIEELKSMLDSMDEAEFKQHVNNEKNDFANWVEHVFGEKKLAHDMKEVSEKDGLIIILEDFLSQKPHEEEHQDGTGEAEHKAEHKGEHREEHKEEHKKESKRLIIPPEKKLSLEPEKELSETEIRKLVDEAMQVFEKHDKKEHDKEDEGEKWADEWEEKWEEKHKPKPEMGKMEKIKPSEIQHHQFVVKEFIYGFIIGLIFGLIMLGVILNLKLS